MPSASRAVTLCGAVLALGLTPASGRTQTIPFDPNGLPVRIGAHLRVRGQGDYSSVFRGRLLSITDDSIALALDSDPAVLVPLAELHGVPVRQIVREKEGVAAVIVAVPAGQMPRPPDHGPKC